MSRTAVTMGTLTPRGELRLDTPPAVRAGRVRVIVEEVAEAQGDIMTVLEGIWSRQDARGHQPRSAAEVDAEINAMRDESEERMREIEALQDRLAQERWARGC